MKQSTTLLQKNRKMIQNGMRKIKEIQNKK